MEFSIKNSPLSKGCKSFTNQIIHLDYLEDKKSKNKIFLNLVSKNLNTNSLT